LETAAVVQEKFNTLQEQRSCVHKTETEKLSRPGVSVLAGHVT